MRMKMNSLSLADTQRQFWRALENNNAAIHVEIYGQADFTQQQRMEVYRTNARSLFVSVLSDTYAVCNKILGKDYFRQIAKKFIQQCPSENHNLNVYGENFSNYIEELITSRTELKDYQYLAGLAALEWKIQVAHFAGDSSEFDVKKFQAKVSQQGQEIIFQLQANVSILSSSFPLLSIWKMYQSDNEIEVVDISTEQEYLCLFRNEFEVLIERISKEVYLLLEAISNEKSLGNIAELFDESASLNKAIEYVMAKQWIQI